MQQTPVARQVYFPIETTGRELAGHILLGTRLAGRGFTVTIGHRNPVARLVRAAPHSGIVYFKGNAQLQLFRRPDFAYVGQDPETGITYRRFEDHVARRSQLFAGLADSNAYFAFGHHDHTFLTAHFPEFAHRIHLTGSPRAMLWGSFGNAFYAKDVEQIRSRYDSFCLAVSRSGRADKRDRKQHPARRRQVADTAELLLTRARTVREATGLSVVIRPHPSESWLEWKRAVQGVPGLHVESAFDLGAWIRAAKFIIQAPVSTAAFESWMAGTPSIASEVPEPHIGRDGTQAELVSHELCISSSLWNSSFGLAEVFSRYRDMTDSARREALVRERIYRRDQDVTEEIADVIEGLTTETSHSQSQTSLGLALTERVRRHSLRRILDRERLGRRIPPPHKRWALQLDRIEAAVKLSEELLGLQSETLVAPVLPNCFQLRTAQSEGHPRFC